MKMLFVLICARPVLVTPFLSTDHNEKAIAHSEASFQGLHDGKQI